MTKYFEKGQCDALVGVGVIATEKIVTASIKRLLQ